MAYLLCSLCILCACGSEGSSIVPEPTPQPTPTPTPDPIPVPTPTPTPTPVEKANRTVLLYMAGDNSLSHFLQNEKKTGDLDELLQGASSFDASFFANNHLIVYVDNSDETFLPTIYRVSQIDGTVGYEVIKTFETDVVSSDLEVIQSVLDVVVSQYPAESYGFIYWSHGDGWLPAKMSAVRSTKPLKYIGVDQQNNTISSKNSIKTDIADLARVLESVGQKFEFVMFDACYMLSMEVVYELRNCAKNMIASPTETPGPGAPYDVLASAMFRDDAHIAMAKAFYDYYAQKYDGEKNNIPSYDNWHGGVAIGVINCQNIDALTVATNQGLAAASVTDNKALRSSVFSYDKRGLKVKDGDDSQEVHYNYDMVDLMKKLMSDDVFTTWKELYDATIIYWSSTPKFFASATGWFSLAGEHGITHYIPQSQDASKTYDIAYHSTAWYKAAGLSRLGW